MTVRIILPNIRARALHAKRRVAALPGMKSTGIAAMRALMTQQADASGIIRLTFTA
jgi:hypothetical protein